MTNKLYVDANDGYAYVVMKCSLGWIAVDVHDGSTYGGIKRLKSECLDGLVDTGYVIDKNRSKPWMKKEQRDEEDPTQAED